MNVATASPVARHVHVLSGLHSGATAELPTEGKLVIGSELSAGVVLCDRGVAKAHCQISLDQFGMSCRALDEVITIDGKPLPTGEIAALRDGQIIECGQAAFSVGPVSTDWQRLRQRLATRGNEPHTLRSLRKVNPYVLFASLLVGLTGALSITYAALSGPELADMPSKVDAARRWLTTIAPQGSELEIGVDQRNGRDLLLSGYVSHNDHRIKLTGDAAASPYRPRVEVFAATEMLDAMSRMASLAQVACEPQYRGGGQLACTQMLPSEQDATRLRMLAKDVPGLRTLDLKWLPPMPASNPTPRLQPTQITQRFAILMWRQQRYLVNEQGKRYREGDEFDGFNIKRIELDRVVFARDGNDYEFFVAALGKRS
ncbi:hypothetical protein GCM10011487_43910 [Steroidobacter agaridevorans]|uniref:YscD cytoplasmic domain-containing protein n=1 Tax=Steroidobacter agaridevorans TaxID=2695856 RepID=A0A829YHT7_9GAMM|nr:FHA domain-containing protein [Steroidobacter agaridevorans]GFE82391.1 hypothetical protein GCM10011487_43910 [Steroidobacter agaridevorans]